MDQKKNPKFLQVFSKIQLDAIGATTEKLNSAKEKAVQIEKDMKESEKK